MTSLAYTYNLLGETSTATSANGAYYFTYNYNAIGQLTGITPSTHDSTHPDSEYSGATYNALEELTAGTYGDGTTVANTYNTRGRLTQITDSVYSLGLGYAPNGSVTTYNDSKAGNWTVTYDAFNRLATGSNATTGAAYSYTYDQFGNRWQQHLTAGTGNEVDYTFNANNQNITSGFKYDIAGNLLQDGSGCNPCWTYDDTSNLVSDSGGASFSYNGLNRRVEKITPDGTKHDFLLDPSGKPFNEYENGNTVFSRVTGGVFTYANGVAYYNHTDHLGTPRVTTDYTGTVQRVETNLPWGDNFAETGSFIDFTGLADGDWDSESNADHFGAREYAKPQGRWLTPDPSGLAAVNPANPQTWNRYAYVTNNPLSFVDPYGLFRQFPGECQGGQGICPDEGGGADPNSIDNGNGGTDFSAIGNSSDDCPICSSVYGAYGTAGIFEGYFGAGQVWGLGSDSGSLGNQFMAGGIVYGDGTDDSPYVMSVSVWEPFGGWVNTPLPASQLCGDFACDVMGNQVGLAPPKVRDLSEDSNLEVAMMVGPWYLARINSNPILRIGPGYIKGGQKIFPRIVTGGPGVGWWWHIWDGPAWPPSWWPF
jgi:RHS repeat-associated protein